MNDKDLDAGLMALADPTRRAILGRLASGEACVTDLAQPFQISLNAVSKHIRVLERARLVRRRRVWREQRVRIDVARLSGLADWIAGQRTAWIDCLNALDLLLTAEDADAGVNNLSQEKRK